jgi:hypothetical protein
MRDLSWATEPLTAWHTDPHMGEGRHQHTWLVSAFWPSKPLRDGRSIKASLRAILDIWEGADLPPELWASEDLAAAVLQLHGNGLVCGVKVERPGFGGCGAGEWR